MITSIVLVSLPKETIGPITEQLCRNEIGSWSLFYQYYRRRWAVIGYNLAQVWLCSSRRSALQVIEASKANCGFPVLTF
jgi:hypothetical protein